jgi:magnesium transporter
MKNPILIPELRELLKSKKYKILKSFLEERHPKEVAEYLEMLETAEIWQLLDLIDIYQGEKIFSYFDMDLQIALISNNLGKGVSKLLMQMSPDIRADLFNHLDKEVADKALILLPISERANIIKLTSYQEGTAGAIMTTDYAVLNENETVEKSIRKIRKEAPSKETIYYLYVVNNDGQLIGFISLRDLILTSPRKKVKTLMKKDIISAKINDDQEKIANLISEYDLLALPIIDDHNNLAGIVTYDDAIDIIHEEQTEDMEKLMAISGKVEEKSYLEVSSLTHFKKRAFWVIFLGFFGLLTGLIVESFQDTLKTLIILSFYIPLLNAAGGNTGSQSATVVLRSLTLKELAPKDIFKVIRKEFVISFLLSICLGVITFARLYFPESGNFPQQFSVLSISMVISISLALQVLWSTIFGATIPILATKVKLDPALVSSPLLTTFVDMIGIIIYFTTAKIILGI